MCIQQIQNYKIQPGPVYVLLWVQPGAYRRSDCPAADSTQSGEEPRWKSLLCSKMDKVELENRVELESKLQISRVELENRLELENMVELEKQLTDLHSRVGAELSRVIICAQVEDERSSVAEVKICKVRYRVRCAPVKDEQCTAE